MPGQYRRLHCNVLRAIPAAQTKCDRRGLQVIPINAFFFFFDVHVLLWHATPLPPPSFPSCGVVECVCVCFTCLMTPSSVFFVFVFWLVLCTTVFLLARRFCRPLTRMTRSRTTLRKCGKPTKHRRCRRVGDVLKQCALVFLVFFSFYLVLCLLFCVLCCTFCTR